VGRTPTLKPANLPTWQPANGFLPSLSTFNCRSTCPDPVGKIPSGSGLSTLTLFSLFAPRVFANSFAIRRIRTAHPTSDAHPERPSGVEGLLSRFALCSLFALSTTRAFHNSFAIRRIRTLSKKCRVYGGHCLPFLKYYFNFRKYRPLFSRPLTRAYPPTHLSPCPPFLSTCKPSNRSARTSGKRDPDPVGTFQPSNGPSTPSCFPPGLVLR
jgi:hypothetical protein